MSYLIERDVLHDIDRIFVEGTTDKLKVRKDEGLVDVKSDGDDVLGILKSQPFRIGLS